MPKRKAPAPPEAPLPLEPADDSVLIAIVRNPLQPARREIHIADPGEWLIDWLQAHFPKGFGAGISLLRNGREIEIAEADFKMEAGDIITLIVHPGAHIALGTLILQAVIGAVIGAATSIIFNLIFGKPKGPNAGNIPTPDPIYSISGAQNAARLAEPVPALYGRMLTTPDYASQPYVYFSGNNQYLDQILCLGWGEYELHDIRVGTTPVSALQGGAVAYWLFGPGDHAQTMGTIEAATGVMENVVSSPEVADQELNGEPSGDVVDVPEPTAQFLASALIDVAHLPPAGYGFFKVNGTTDNNRNFSIQSITQTGPSKWRIRTNEFDVSDEHAGPSTVLRYYRSPEAVAVGPFVASKPGAIGNRIIADFVYPNGLYTVDESSGELVETPSYWHIDYQAIDDAGNPTGAFVTYGVTVVRATNTPVRLSYAIDVPPGRYRVRVIRDSPPPVSAQQVSNFVWTGLKFRLVPTAHPIYGAVSLLVVRIRATNGITGNASSRISADVTRKLPPLGGGALRASRDPAEAFADIYCNPDYGARRPLGELDLPELQRLQAHWAGEARFDGGFAQKSTIWEALSIVMQTAGAAPLPLGQLMSAAQDGVKALRTQLFSDANIRKGTLSIGYSFDKPGDNDGIRTEYRDPATWNPAYQQWPAEAQDPDSVVLFGCADAGQALGFAKLLWQKRSIQRKTARFETELEGLIPRLGDRVAIAVQLPRWARAGVVIAAAGQTLTLDQGLAPEEWAAGGWLIVLRNEYGEPSGPIAVSPGARANEILLAIPAPFEIFGTGRQEPTHYALGTAEEAIADFSVANIEHRGGVTIGIEALAYNPAVFADTLPWLERPI